MQSLEAFFLWNFALDLLLSLAVFQICAGREYRHCLEAALFGSVYALFSRISPFSWLGELPAAVFSGGVMALLAARPDRLSSVFKALLALAGASLLMAGAQLFACQRRWAGPAQQISAAIAGTLLCLWLQKAKHARLETWDVQLYLHTDRGRARFRALVDTGNRLHEPISGLPVMIVEEKALAKALPEGFNAKEALKNLPPGFRMVSYGVLGNGGRLPCFRPENLMVLCQGSWQRAPDLWVAIYPGRIPGQVSALAPAVLGTIESANNPHGKWAEKREVGRL